MLICVLLYNVTENDLDLAVFQFRIYIFIKFLIGFRMIQIFVEKNAIWSLFDFSDERSVNGTQ